MKAIFVISGEKQTGKTCFLQKLVSLLADAGYRLKGFYAWHDKVADSYFIKNIQTGEKELLMTRTTPQREKPGQFQIHEDGIRTGIAWIEAAKKDSSSVLVVDEIGLFELKGMVWHDLFSDAVKSPKSFLFTTKTKLLPEVLAKWKIHPTAVFYPPDFTSPEKSAKQITEALKLSEHIPRHQNNHI